MPWAPDVPVIYEHFHRYLWAARVLAGRSILDVGSGEGFGGAILSDSASSVTGVDVDERAVEHSRLNYFAPNLRFDVASALDLSAFEEGSFGGVVAFEIIEHVSEQERVLDEIARVLAEDGILVISTPDRRAYTETSGNVNPFHEHELALEEFLTLIKRNFPNVASWGQRTITGSHMNPLDRPGSEQSMAAPADFFLERSGEEWRVPGDPAPLYCVAIASRIPLPAVPASSTLADCDLELLRFGEREQAERVRRQLDGEWRRELADEKGRDAVAVRELQAQAREAQRIRDRDIDRQRADIEALRREVSAKQELVVGLDGELAEARLLNRRIEESVLWNGLQAGRERFYGAIGGDRSLLARALSMFLRLAGRAFMRPAPRPTPPEPAEEPAERELLTLPDHPRPKVSIVIPVHARADLTLACLESIHYRTTRVSYEVIIVEDLADAETRSLLARIGGARILHNERNLGYLRSVNRAAATARGEWLVLLNNDTEVADGWLTALLECGESAEDVAIVTPKYLYPDGTLNEAGAVIWRDGTGANYGRGEDPAKFEYEYRRETDYGSAAALLVRADFWREAGGFDERFLPMYYEDVDLCFEARERGLRVLYEPDAVVIHVEGATAGNDVEASHKRHQEENRPRFVEKWRHRLEAEHLPPGPRNLRLAADRHRGPHVLIVDHLVPMWDRDAGSLRMLAIMRALIGLGARVTFMSENLAAIQPYTRRLQRMGVEVLYGPLDMNAELATVGPTLSAAILSRPHPTSRWLDSIREFAPAALVAYDTVDLHWLREARRNALGSGGRDSTHADDGGLELAMMGGKAEALRQLELALIRASDVTIVVSEAEREQVARDVPSARTLLVPMVHEVERFVPPPQGRSGILFLGGFMHPPNTGAAIRLVREVMPIVWREWPDVKVTIVGSDPPPEVLALASPLVEIAGWVEDLQPTLERSRMLAAPLTYGAGLKGKVTQAMAVGLPVVTTATGVEGLQGMDDCALVAEDAAELAAHVIRLLEDDELWWQLSGAGQELIQRNCSPEVLGERLGELLESPRGAAISA